jgi:hypothetical protein
MDEKNPKNFNKLSPVQCGKSHQKSHGSTGYDTNDHWCQKGQKYFFDKYHCPTATGLKVAIKLKKGSGEVKCLSKDKTTCYEGKDLQEICENTNQCKKRKEERSLHSNVKPKDESADAMNAKPGKGNVFSLGCESNNKDLEGIWGYFNEGKHWCKESVAYFRYTGEWLLNSATKLNHMVRLNPIGEVECLSQDGNSCLDERGGDAKMKSQIDSLTNSGQTKPKTVSCKKDEFKDNKKWCYRAGFLLLGKHVPKNKNPKKKDESKKEKKKKEEDKNEDVKPSPNSKPGETWRKQKYSKFNKKKSGSEGGKNDNNGGNNNNNSNNGNNNSQGNQHNNNANNSSNQENNTNGNNNVNNNSNSNNNNNNNNSNN